jgi:hypothetical protein
VLAGLLVAVALATAPGSPLGTPALSLDAPVLAALRLASTEAEVARPVLTELRARDLTFRSSWGALGLTALCEVPTLLVGPSCGHLYAGETEHFAVTGGLRVVDLLALYALEKWAYGTPPLYAVIQPHFSRSLSAYPLAYPVDLVLVALWCGTGLYDLVDSFFAAKRHNHRAELWQAVQPMPDSPALPLVRF